MNLGKKVGEQVLPLVANAQSPYEQGWRRVGGEVTQRIANPTLRPAISTHYSGVDHQTYQKRTVNLGRLSPRGLCLRRAAPVHHVALCRGFVRLLAPLGSRAGSSTVGDAWAVQS